MNLDMQKVDEEIIRLQNIAEQINSKITQLEFYQKQVTAMQEYINLDNIHHIVLRLEVTQTDDTQRRAYNLVLTSDEEINAVKNCLQKLMAYEYTNFLDDKSVAD